MITIYVEGDAPIKLGHVRDNEAYRVAFPIRQTLELYGAGGVWNILYKRPTEAVAYPVPPNRIYSDVNFLYWVITATEVQFPGKGECQLSYMIGDVTKMSYKWQTGVCSSLISGGNAPSYIESWLTELLNIRNDAVSARDQAVESAEAIEDMGVSSVQLPYTETAYVDKTFDEETGHYHLEFGIPKGKDGAGGALRFIYVDVLPARPDVGDEDAIYCIPLTTPSATDKWQGYRWIEDESRWEAWGGTTIDLTGYAKLEDIPRVAVVVFGVTPFATIKDLASEGYAVFCAYYDGATGYRTYPLSNITGASAIFVIPFYTDTLSGVQFREAKCLKADNSWTHRTYYAELQSNKVTTIDSSNAHYPSSQAVKDYVDAKKPTKVEYSEDVEGGTITKTIDAETLSMKQEADLFGEASVFAMSVDTEGISVRDSGPGYDVTHRIPIVRVLAYDQYADPSGVDGSFGSIKIEDGIAYIYTHDEEVEVSEYETETVPVWEQFTWPSVEGVQF